MPLETKPKQLKPKLIDNELDSSRVQFFLIIEILLQTLDYDFTRKNGNCISFFLKFY